MAYFASLAIAVSVALSMFLTGTYQSFSNFHNQGQALRSWDEMALASSSTVARSSSNLLAGLQDSYEKSLNTYKEANSADFAENSRRLRLLEEFAASLDIDSDSDLKRTVEFGLNHEAQLSEDPSKFPNRYTGYQVRLIHSDHIPTKLEANDKTYRSTLISSNSEPVDLNTYLNRCRHSEKIKIKRSLLNELVGESAAETIAANPEIFATKISDSGISLASLPNGLEIDIEMELPGTDEDESKVVKKTVTKRSTAQLRLSAGDIDLDLNFSCSDNLIGVDSRCPCLSQHIGLHANCPCQLSNRGVLATCPCREGDYGNTGGCPCRPGIDAACTSIQEPNGGGGGPHSNTSTGQLQNLELKIIPSDMMKKFGKDRLGIFYDPNKPVDANNPIRIVNIDRGGYFALYQEPNGFLNISLGAIPFKSNGLKQLKDKFNPRELNLEAGVKFTIYDPSTDSNADKVDVDNLTIDVLPRARKRYGHPNQYATIGGVPLTPRHLIVGTRRKDLTDVGRPGFGQFGNFRAYDPDTGALVGIFSHDQVKKECGNCFDFKYTEQGNAIRNGARVYQNFNSAEILKLNQNDEFNSLTPENKAYKANNIWLNIQSDLASDTQMAINSGQNSWTKRILRDLNSQEQVYLEGLFVNYHKGRLTRQEVIKALGFKDNVAHKDDFAAELYQRQYDTLLDFAELKDKHWKGTPFSDNRDLISKQKNFENSITDYDNYIRYNKKPGLVVKNESKPNSETNNESNKEESSNDNQEPNRSGKKIDCSKKKNRNKKACKGNNSNNKNGNKNSNASASKNQGQSNARPSRNNNANRGNQNSNRGNSNKGNGKKNKNKNKKGKGSKKKR